MRLLKPGAVAAVVLSVSLFTGCLLTRVNTVRRQLCEYEENFEIRTDEGLTVTMNRPVLLDRDVTWLAGTGPSESAIDEDVLVMRYIVERNVEIPNPEHDLRFQLEFVELDRRYRLRQSRTDIDLSDFVSPSVVAGVMEQACRAKPNLLRRTASIDLSALDPSTMPDRAELVTLLGEPNEFEAGGSTLIYEHRIRNAEPTPAVLRTEVHFDPAGERLLRVRSRFLRYELDADFVANKALVKFRI